MIAWRRRPSRGVEGYPVNLTSARELLINLAVVPGPGNPDRSLGVYATGAAQPKNLEHQLASGVVALAKTAITAWTSTQHVDVAIVASAGASTAFIIDVAGYCAWPPCGCELRGSRRELRQAWSDTPSEPASGFAPLRSGCALLCDG